VRELAPLRLRGVDGGDWHGRRMERSMTSHYGRLRGEHGPKAPTAVLLGAMLAAGGDTQKQAAERILDALRANDGNRTHAARTLGVSTRSLMRWIADYALLAGQGLESRGTALAQ
jgi:DNA-binding NtrC family response regulator